jgi:nicotinamidase-related amidase
MSTIHLDDRAALVLIDIQKGILQMPTATPTDDIKKRCMQLAEAFHARELPVVRVVVGWSPDGGDLPRMRAVKPGPVAPPPAEFMEFPDDFAPAPHDIVITKRHWGAFAGTELDLQLRRRGVTQVVLAGISTSIGVESTARSAWEHSYNLLFVQDAMTDPDAASHEHSLTKIFPRLGEIADTDQVVAKLGI